ncbi:MAG TPA: nucleotidyltransferase [Terriglobia bacterium]|nr:nucleotidyltransferase [Terriglobia bacterium]
MSIPESQFDTWAHQGSITQSSTTYAAIKNTLEASGTPYTGKNYEVFLQGSYGNDTNIYAESDVDVVIVSKVCFHSDLSALPDDQKNAYHAAYANATYTFGDFKRDVLDVLTKKYGQTVKAGDKAIYIPANGGRRNADVIAAVQYRRYYKFQSIYNESFGEGICFFNAAGTLIANYPKQHSANCTTKHQGTGGWFKPLVRILKNARNKMIDDGMIDADLAPSYYLEGLLYNVPNDQFKESYQDCFANSIDWIQKADRSKFVCANEQYYLLRENSPVTWRASKCDEFLTAIAELRKEW